MCVSVVVTSWKTWNIATCMWKHGKKCVCVVVVVHPGLFCFMLHVHCKSHTHTHLHILWIRKHKMFSFESVALIKYNISFVTIIIAQYRQTRSHYPFKGTQTNIMCFFSPPICQRRSLKKCRRKTSWIIWSPCPFRALKRKQQKIFKILFKIHSFIFTTVHILRSPCSETCILRNTKYYQP